jgi:hypothetical protein
MSSQEGCKIFKEKIRKSIIEKRDKFVKYLGEAI